MKTNRLFLTLLLIIAALPAFAQWTPDSTLNTRVRDTTGLNLTDTKIVTAANGNSFISWAEPRFGAAGYQYRMQLVDSNGYNLWGARGITIDTAIGTILYRYDLKVDRLGNAIIAVQDHRSGANKPVAFKVSQLGVMQWGANGLVLEDTMATSGLNPAIAITDSNNAIISWTATGATVFSSALKITPAGTTVWPDNLRVIDPASGNSYERAAPVALAGDELILLYVERTPAGVSTMYAMRYAAAGASLWVTRTRVSSNPVSSDYYPAPIPDGHNGFFISFTTGNTNNPAISDVYMQRVYTNGRSWDPVGIKAIAGTTTQKYDAGAVFIPAINKFMVPVKFTNTAQSAAGIQLQKVDTAGNIRFGAAGIQLVPMSSGAASDIINVAGTTLMDTSIVIVYTIGMAPSPVTIRALKVDTLSNMRWTTPGGSPISTNASIKSKISVGSYAKKQVVVAWTDQRLSNGGAYAQNIFTGGTLGSRPCEVFVLSPATFPLDTVGYAYNVALTQTGGVGNVTYAVTFGVLPPGLTLSAAGVITGTPTDQGSYPFILTATDANGCVNSYTYSITVLCRPAYLNPFPTICDTIQGFVLTGGSPAGGTYSGQNVISGVFNAVAAGAGSHTVNYTFSTGTTGPCVRTVSQNIEVVHCATGVNSVSGGIVFRMYPNPTTGQVTLKMDNAAAARMRIRIVSLTGQTVLLEEADGSSNFQKTYDLSAYPKGIYVVEVSTAKESARVKISLQ